ncbi:ubiquitin carboxyl-terminal hydrolase 8 [Augochlora pura]
MLSSKMTEKGTLKYTSINELLQKAKVDYRNKKPIEVSKRLPIMYNNAAENAKQGNEEDQYIMLRRWLNSVEWLKTTQEYKTDKLYSPTHLNVNRINEVKKILAALKTKLDTRYEEQAKARILEKNINLEEMDIDNDAGVNPFMSSLDLQLPETPIRDPSAGDNEEMISCEQLFKLVLDIYGRYLIIDIRSKSHYENSRIRSNKCVNIPSSEIKSGALAHHFEKYLRKDRRAMQLYKERSAQYVDVTILLDWNTSSKTLGLNNPLTEFRKILENWDPGIINKKVTILDGGYKEWLTRYPAYTTNPNIAEPKLNNIPTEILDDIEYPEWIHFDDEDNLNKTREKKMLSLKSVNKEENTRKDVSTNEIGYKQMDVEILKIHNNIASKKSNNYMNTGSTVAKNDIVEVDKIKNSNDVWLELSDTPLKLEQEMKLSTRKKSNISVKPTVDRSKKPILLDTSTSETKTVLKLLRQQNELAKIHMRLEHNILEHERSLHDQYLTEYENSSGEAYIRDNSLKSLRQKLEEKKKEYKKLEDELVKYNSRFGPIQFNPADDMEKRSLEFNLAAAKFDMKNIAKEREKLGEKTAKIEYKDSPNKSDSSIHTESIKSDSSSTVCGLERSYSSPNLLQLIDRKAPRVDRTSKPQIPLHNQNGLHANEKISHISWANREERMTPVHGSVHPGITGLKNLGNSCYMNSIIQCLSNTTQLAKYFTDNLYTGDLNTNNDNNTQGQVVEEVAHVIKALWRGQYKSISPLDLKIAVGQYKLQFESYEQQDSHEFLTFLLDWMHNDLKRKCKVPLDMTVAEEAWNKAMGSMRSIISDLFFGHLRSTITCSYCEQSSTTYESFNSLTTSLPHSNRCTLNDCILKFVTGQKVIGWKCPKCQTPREATKKFDFVKLAPIVVIHLNRFAESGGWLEKRNTAVDFPLTDFNLKPYLVTDNNTPTISNIRSYNYSLYAMSNHYGTMEGGHYTAYCKNAAQNKWYKYDDQTVTEVTTNQVKSQNTSAYLLFYTSFSSNII